MVEHGDLEAASRADLVAALYSDRESEARAELERRAFESTRAIFEELPVSSLLEFRSLIAAKLSVALEFILDEHDFARVSQGHQQYFDFPLEAALRDRLDVSRAEGVLLRRDGVGPGTRRFLAVIDARGEKGASRAYFTAWHELAHVLIADAPPPHGVLSSGATRDPLERLVDHVASRLGFYEPIFAPIVSREEATAKPVTFGVIERIRQAAAPDASLQATAIAAVRHMSRACVLVTTCRDEEGGELVVRNITWSQVGFDDVDIHVGQRVPERSIVRRLVGTRRPEEEVTTEDAVWWGRVRPGRTVGHVSVAAISRANFVYALLSPAP